MCQASPPAEFLTVSTRPEAPLAGRRPLRFARRICITDNDEPDPIGPAAVSRPGPMTPMITQAFSGTRHPHPFESLDL
eukprot:318440-Hanusia_phi.AAC.1